MISLKNTLLTGRLFIKLFFTTLALQFESSTIKVDVSLVSTAINYSQKQALDQNQNSMLPDSYFQCFLLTFP